MGLSIVRVRIDASTTAWGLVRDGSVQLLEGDWPTTGALLEHAIPALAEERIALGAPRPLAELSLLSPVTHPCRVIAQAMNYGAHAREVGSSAEARTSNVLFQKSSASLSPPTGAIVRPSHVELLDYEIELGLVIGKRTRGPVDVQSDNLGDFIGGLVVTNDVSARDVQVPEGQFYKGKSYRTFTPCGPILFVPTGEELRRWPELRLELTVNGELRQSAKCGDMIFAPAATLRELSTIEDLEPGDLLLTGTPGGVALAPPPRFVQAIGGLLPEATRWRLFVAGQKKRRQYLQDGDRVVGRIRLPDGAIDLGTQNLCVERSA